MKRELRLYNVIFPIWLLFLFPTVLILVIPANLAVDSLVLLLTLLARKHDGKRAVQIGRASCRERVLCWV